MRRHWGRTTRTCLNIRQPCIYSSLRYANQVQLFVREASVMDNAAPAILDSHQHFLDARRFRYPVFASRNVGFEALFGDSAIGEPWAASRKPFSSAIVAPMSPGRWHLPIPHLQGIRRFLRLH